ncbi:MAG: nuclear transport factor 2 family protein [Gemmatimonadaceae bacterium]
MARVATTTTTGAFIDALHALERDRNSDAMVRLFADDAELSNATHTEPQRGAEAARHFWHGYRESFDEIASEFRNVVESEGAALLEWTSRGRLAGGGEVEYSGVSVLELDGERIRRFRAYFDPADLTRR